MALVRSDRMIGTYTDDFGTEYPNLNVKFGDDVPNAVVQQLYATRTDEVNCGAVGLFVPRALIATFTNGNIHRFPLASRETADIEEAVLLLKSNNAACIDLEGESWNLVPQTFFAGATFRTSPFTDIPSAKVQESVSFDYTPDIQASGNVRLSTRIETAPTALNACQKSALSDVEVQGGGICSGRSLGISPRKYIIQAVARKSGETAASKPRRVSRNAIVSDKSAATIKSQIDGIAPCAYCVGYRGESVKNVHLLFNEP
ncbi:hypothetical protein [Microcystis sp. M061S2]|uniref:hypothetical protein n=1 Tax=Microcystis sp. M061S2 TaxID=2771171 RepID=UPI0025874F67|nr:hypothetical protein [Microcystis sp. M061S2]MCA2652893.1 hypothetical protein [Microcystis sp. M061S2]